jgi:hypothetical protein
MTSVTAGGPGLVAVGWDLSGGEDLDFDAVVWTSPDGISWSLVPDEEGVFSGEGDQQMHSVIAGGPGLVAVGSDRTGNDPEAAVWTSPDGITWSRVPNEWVRGSGGEEMLSVTVGGPGLVAVGFGGLSDQDAAVWTGVSDRFIDIDGNIFENAIEWLADQGITKGCNPPVNDKFCPNDNVTRGEMAVFLVRAMGYTDNGGGNLFIDDDGLFYENAADRLFTAGVTQGCNPPVNNKYCGERNVTRGEMAAFLVRAMGYTDNGGGNLFVDDDGHLFENAIDKLGAAKVTLGCNPPVNDKFCPNDFVTRGQMAAFLKRALT